MRDPLGGSPEGEVDNPGVTLGAFWKHTPSTCSETWDPRRGSGRRRSQRALLGRPLRAQRMNPRGAQMGD